MLITGGGIGPNLSSAEIFDPATGVSVLTGSMIQSRSGHRATLLDDGRVLITGGFNDSNTHRATAELYDPVVETFTLLPTLMSTARASHVSVKLDDVRGRVLIAGGQGPSGNVATAELFDPTMNTFSSPIAMQEVFGRHLPAATRLDDGRVLIIGGFKDPGFTVSDSAEIFDPATDSFSSVGALTGPRARSTVHVLSNTDVLIAGGVFASGGGADLQTTEIFDVLAGTFRPGPLMTTARSNHAAANLVDGRVILIGGNPGSGFVGQATAEIFVPAPPPTHELVQVGSLSFPRTEASASLLLDGRVLIAGGRTGHNGPNLVTAEIYDPATESWTLTGNMNRARRAAPLVTLQDGRVLVVGGEDIPNPNIPHKTLEMFDPTTGTFTLLAELLTEPEGRNTPEVTLLPDGRVLITGGATEGRNLESAEIFDPNAPVGSQLTALPNMSVRRGGHTSTLLADGRVLIAGGGTGAGFNQTAEIFDPVSKTFMLIADPMSATRAGAGATLLPDGRVFIVGGGQTSGEIFDPVSETFTGTMATGAFRGTTSAILLSSGLVAVGGHADIVELYDPNADTFSAAAHSALGVRHSGTATLLNNDRVLYAAGNDGQPGPNRSVSSAEELRSIVPPDTTPPNPPSTPDLVAASDSGSSDSDDMTNDNAPTVSGTAEADATVTLFDGAVAVGSGVATGGAWTITTTLLSDGAHNFTAAATDAAGNVSAASGALAVTVDTTSPATPSTPDLVAASDSGSSDSDDITNDHTPTVSGTAEAEAGVRLYAGAVEVGSATAAMGAWTITASPLVDGVHSLTATATDAAGNVSAASGALVMTVDTTSPAAPGTPDLVAASDSGLLDSDDVTNDHTPTVSGAAEAEASVRLYAGAVEVGSATAAVGAWTITASPLADGVHSLTATATDAAGNVSPVSGALAVTVDTTAPAAPSTADLDATSDSGASDIDDITNDDTPTLSGTAEADSSVRLFAGAVEVASTAAVGGAWQITASLLADGVHSLTATATDAAGNESAASGALAVTVDTVNPNATILSPADGAVFVVNEVVISDWSASDALSGVDSAVGTVPSGAAVPTAAAGFLSFTVAVTDVAGNVRSVTHDYTVQTPSEATDELEQDIEDIGLPGGTENALLSSLEAALDSIAAGEVTDACNQLNAFINKIEAQRGKKISDADADALIASALLIQGGLGCT